MLYLTGEQRPVETEDDRYPVISHPPVKAPEMVDITVHMPHEPRNALWAQENRIVHHLMEYFFKHGEEPTLRLVGTDPMEPGKSHILKMANEIKQSRIFIGPDSGGFHIAAALGIPTIASLTNKFPPSMRSYSKVVCVEDHRMEEVFSAALAMYRRIRRG